MDWADDVAALGDALALPRFAVAGISGGGPYALACAWRLADRVSAVGVVSGTGMFQLPEATKGMPWSSRLSWAVLRHAPWTARPMMGTLRFSLQRFPQRTLQRYTARAPAADKAILTRPDFRRLFLADVRETFRQGARGAAHDLRLYTGPWGIPLDEIQLPVHLWHGEADSIVPAAMGRAVAAALPRCHATFLPRAGHLWFVDHLDEVMATLAPPEPTASG